MQWPWSRACRLLSADQRARKCPRIKMTKVIHLFANADGMYGETKPFSDGHEHTATGSAIKFRHDQSTNVARLPKKFDLAMDVLTSGRIKNEYDTVGRARVLFPHDSHDLLQLGHQTGFVLQTSRRIDKENVFLVRLRGSPSIEREPSGISTNILGKDVSPGALTPNLQLINRRRAESIGRGDRDGQPLRYEEVGQFADGGGLPSPIDADDENDERRAGWINFQGDGNWRQDSLNIFG